MRMQKTMALLARQDGWFSASYSHHRVGWEGTHRSAGNVQPIHRHFPMRDGSREPPLGVTDPLSVDCPFRRRPYEVRSGGCAVAAKPPRVELVEATPERYVLDIPLGRVIIEPDGVRFHRNGRGRGLTVVGGKGE
jgi:hypothetical protein